ncbi:ABC transporter substrate-binding protein [Catellatospora citrea]|uniref:ABC transporter substrate-binding protein n=1 Tax=Catellatospora citrea TaxID=53366 RepID=A0A8J3K9N5_9ACTN|nr:ABC transporter substrate-binding protein [Catellatospora citrea]RKE06958.1 peptide/nickel transport system substrate-binding protein [Catellatospora citrea]GIF95108.1 ABC transporter substrate-binding protein [Catellatospora citrea]
MPDLSMSPVHASTRASRKRRRLVAAAAAVTLLGVASACDSAADANDTITQGGTLRVVLPALPDHLDPQKIAAAMDANISRLISRTLTTYKAEPGTASSELVPDLATDLGRPSENNTVWEFKLREGVKWEDGSPVVCSQLKYGVERNFAKVFDSGLPYAELMLADNATPYEGPYSGKELDSVVCEDTQTIKFRLKQPAGDFNYTVALSIFSPTKQGADGDKDAYDIRPLSSGPYRVEPRPKDATGFTLVRNEHWSSTLDSVRKAHPDKIVFAVDANDPAVTNALIQDQGADRNTIVLQTNVAPNFLQQVINDPKLSQRVAQGPSGAVRYFAINTELVKNLDCRKALSFAFNKRKYRQAMGGSVIGELATSMIPPNLAAHAKFDIYRTLSDSDGDEDEALKLLDKAKNEGKPCPDKLKVALPDNDTIARYVKTMVDAYIRIGIKVELNRLPAKSYFGDIADIGHGNHLVYAGWIPDWANGSAVIPPLFDGALVKPSGEQSGSNYSFLNDPEINKAIADAMAEDDLNRQYKLWGEIDNRLSDMAVTIPVLYPKSIRMYGSNVAGAFIHSQFGAPDLASLGLKDPSIPVDVTSSGS